MPVWSKLISSLPFNKWRDLTTEYYQSVPVSATLAVGVVSLALITWMVRRDKRKLPPGPIGLPYLGAVHKVGEKLHQDVEKMRSQYGYIISFVLFNKLWVVLSGYDIIKEAFIKQSEDFAGRPEFGLEQMNEFFDQIFMAEYNHIWKKNKKFAVTALRKFGFGTSQLEGKIIKEYDVITEIIKKKGTSSFSVRPILRLSLARVISYIVFDREEEETDEDMQVLIDYSLIFGQQTNINPIMMLLPVWLLKILFNKEESQGLRGLRGINRILQEKMRQHKLTYDPNNPRDVMDIYLSRQDKDMTEKDIASTLAVFIPDAVDTLSHMIASIILHIVSFPQVQSNIHAELDKVVGATGKVSLTHKNDLPYLQAAILECYRFVDVTPTLTPHRAMSDTKLCGFDVPKDSVVIANMHSVHYDHKIFPNPDRFDPGHFLDKDGLLINADHCLPFGLGRRMCLGEMLAKLETFLFVANLLQEYQFSFPVDQPQPSLEPDLMLGVFQIPKAFKLHTEIRNK